MTTDQLRRFLAKVDNGGGSCWRWTASKTPQGYGKLMTAPRLELAHRLSYEHFIAPIPDGLTIDHLCRNRGCVNPMHLEPVTRSENSRRGLRGVLLTPEMRERCYAHLRGKPQPKPPTWRANVTAGIRAYWARKRESAA